MSNDNDEIEVTEEAKQFISYIEKMSVLELSKLVKLLENKFGVSASMPIASAGINSSENSSKNTSNEPEKTSFDVFLNSFGSAKIAVIKSVRAITGLGLADSKSLVESAPKVIKEGISKEEAEKIKNELESAGAVVEIK